MDEILIRVREAPGLFLAIIKTHLADRPMDSGDTTAWWLLHDLQAVLFKLALKPELDLDDEMETN